MIKGTQLVGRAVIDMEAAQRLGKIKEIIVQRDGERVAGFVVVHGETIVGSGGTRRTIPASALHSIGPDAVTIRGTALKDRPHDLDKFPRMSDVIGHKMVTRSGRLLGSIDDVLIDGTDGTIVGYLVGGGMRGKLGNIFNPQRPRIHGYVRADADLQVGNDLIVVPDDALIEGEPGVQQSDRKPATQKVDETVSRGWAAPDSRESKRSSIWTQRTDGAAHAASPAPATPPLESETARPLDANRPPSPSDEATREASSPIRQDEPVPTRPQDQSAK